MMHANFTDWLLVLFPVRCKAEGRKLVSKPIERFAYYPIAGTCFAVIQTNEDRPNANFISKKGLV